MVDSGTAECTADPTLEAPYESCIDDSTESLEWAIFDRIGDAMDVDPACQQIPVSEQINPDSIRRLFTNEDPRVSVSFPV